MIWQFAQHIKRLKAAQGEDVAIYVRCRVRINGRRSKLLIDPKVDIASVSWQWFEHNSWVLESEDYLNDKPFFPRVGSLEKQEDLRDSTRVRPPLR